MHYRNKPQKSNPLGAEFHAASPKPQNTLAPITSINDIHSSHEVIEFAIILAEFTMAVSVHPCPREEAHPDIRRDIRHIPLTATTRLRSCRVIDAELCSARK
jgi:hypothetical protein